MNPPELSRSIVPPGGFTYEQPLRDGTSAHIQGASYDNVLEVVLRYRQVNGPVLPDGCLATPDGVWADYNAQVCASYPWLCRPYHEPMSTTVGPQAAGTGWEMLLLRMQRWLDSVRVQPIDWVDTKTANDRANICLSCPQNIAWESNCGSCNQNLKTGSAAVRGARRLASDSALKGCRAWGTFLELAVWMQNPGGEPKHQVPAICWRK